MQPQYFGFLEAMDKVGRIVKSRVALASIPAGMIGQVNRVQPLLDGSCVVVRWCSPPIMGRRPTGTPEDYFTKELYNLLLEEVIS